MIIFARDKYGTMGNMTNSILYLNMGIVVKTINPIIS